MENTLSTGYGSLKAFLLAHPISVAVAGGALVGVGTYLLMNKFLNKKEEPVAAAPTATA